MDEKIIVGMVTPYLHERELTYDEFEEIFSMLSRKEQYAVLDVLDKNNIELVDSYSDLTDSDDEIVVQDQKDEFELLYDERLFTDESIEDETKASNRENKTTHLLVRKKIKISNGVLVRMIQEGNQQAKQDLCIKNQGLVEKYANVYQRLLGNTLEFEDLVQAGMIGLIKAAEKYDPKNGAEFSTYAVYWIKQLIRREIMDCGYSVRIPVHKMEQIIKVVRLDSQYSYEMDYHKRMLLISETSRMPVTLIENCLQLYYEFITATSLDSPVGEEGDVSIGDFVPYEDGASVEDNVIQSELKNVIEEVMKSLRDKEQKVLRMRFGLDGGGVRTLEEVGKVFGVTRERIRQIEEKAIRKLRYSSMGRPLREFYD